MGLESFFGRKEKPPIDMNERYVGPALVQGKGFDETYRGGEPTPVDKKVVMQEGDGGFGEKGPDDQRYVVKPPESSKAA